MPSRGIGSTRSRISLRSTLSATSRGMRRNGRCALADGHGAILALDSRVRRSARPCANICTAAMREHAPRGSRPSCATPARSNARCRVGSSVASRAARESHRRATRTRYARAASARAPSRTRHSALSINPIHAPCEASLRAGARARPVQTWIMRNVPALRTCATAVSFHAYCNFSAWYGVRRLSATFSPRDIVKTPLRPRAAGENRSECALKPNQIVRRPSRVERGRHDAERCEA